MRAATAAAMALALGSCSGPSLDGSLSEAFDLSFSSMLIRRSEKALQLSYLKSEGREVVVAVTVATEGLGLKPGARVELGGEYAPGHPRTVVSRAVDGEPVRTLPPVLKGTLTVDQLPTSGSTVTGDFSVSFGEGGDVGSGRTLFGNFSAKVELAP
ncbi:MAG: hypothetical protein HY901_06125 [Deltaproteobacteria bacterium]|nr:hypothetical protein [Deltaproteobacteria bacterium]